MSDQVVVMREGGVEQAGTPDEIYERPATPFVATLIGRMNQVAGIVGADGRSKPPGSTCTAPRPFHRARRPSPCCGPIAFGWGRAATR